MLATLPSTINVQYVIYGLFANDEIFYVGKTTAGRLSKRMNEHRCRAGKSGNVKVYNKIRKLLAASVDVTIKVLHSVDSEVEQTAKEIELISQHGIKTRKGGKLYNSTVGGEGVTGWSHSDEAKRKMSEAKKGNTVNVGRTRTDTSIKFSKPVYFFNLDGSFYGKYASSRLADKALGADYKQIYKALDGRIRPRVFSKALNCYMIVRSKR